MLNNLFDSNYWLFTTDAIQSECLAAFADEKNIYDMYVIRKLFIAISFNVCRFQLLRLLFMTFDNYKQLSILLLERTSFWKKESLVFLRCMIIFHSFFRVKYIEVEITTQSDQF